MLSPIWLRGSSSLLASVSVLPAFCDVPDDPPVDPVLGCEAAPWPRSPSVELLDGSISAVSADGKVVVGESSEGPVIWAPNKLVLPVNASLPWAKAEVTNCDGTVFAGGYRQEFFNAPVWGGSRQTRTTAPTLLELPSDRSPEGSRVQAISADGQVLVGYEYNGANWPSGVVWDAGGHATRLGVGYWKPSVVSPDGVKATGRSDCATGLACPGVEILSWSTTGSAHSFIPSTGELAKNADPVISHDGTTAAGSPLDADPDPTFSSVVWFRDGGDTVEIACPVAPCWPVAMTSHGSVLLLSTGHIWTESHGLRTFLEFLSDARVRPWAEGIQPTGISDDGRVIVGYGGPPSSSFFKLTLSREAYR